MTRIAICNASIELGDAVSNDMIGMYNALIEHGFEVRLFVKECTVNGLQVTSVKQITQFLKDPNDLFIYHYATGWDVGIKLLQDLQCKKVVKYHNVTPPSFFDGISEDYANVCREGRLQLAQIAHMDVDLYLADSEFNKGELIAAGCKSNKCKYVPPFHHIDRLFSMHPDQNVMNQYNDGKINILTVGRLAPNKGHPALIASFADYYYHYNSNSRLFIVGKLDKRLNSYIRTLHEIAARFHLKESVVFSGGVSDEALKAFYLLTHVFMLMSEHEGFCVPLVESMAMKIPIVTYGSSAVSGTVENAGFVWDECVPEFFSCSINRIVREEPLREALIRRGWNRYINMFTTQKIETSFLESLKDFL